MRLLIGMKQLGAVVAVALLCVAGCSDAPRARGGTDFAGRWTGSAQKTGSANPTMQLDIVKEGDTFSGTLSTLDGTFQDAVIADARIEKGALLFRVVANGGTLYKDHLFLFSLRREGTGITGTWTDILEGAEGPFVLEAASE